MKERPILFNNEMVRALLKGRKTQTRRAIKPQPLGYTGRKYIVPDDAPKAWQDSDDFLSFCPYGQPGDRLWVRETWSHTGQGVWRVRDAGMALGGNLIYRASNDLAGVGWFPSIHMPRWASRILLEVTAVRVERLQEIDEQDAQAEGAHVVSFPNVDEQRTDRDRFRALWDLINGAGSWDANPWVWVVEFRVIEPGGVAA